MARGDGMPTSRPGTGGTYGKPAARWSQNARSDAGLLDRADLALPGDENTNVVDGDVIAHGCQPGPGQCVAVWPNIM